MLKLLRWCRYFEREYFPLNIENSRYVSFDSVKREISKSGLKLGILPSEIKLSVKTQENDENGDKTSHSKKTSPVTQIRLSETGNIKQSHNNWVDSCFICRCKDFCEIEDGILFCQNCLYRKCLFLRGASLECCECEIGLNEINFEFWQGKAWCRNCTWRKCMERKLVFLE